MKRLHALLRLKLITVPAAARADVGCRAGHTLPGDKQVPADNTLYLVVKSSKPVVRTASMQPSAALSADGPLNSYMTAPALQAV
jgi:hypothetical protein